MPTRRDGRIEPGQPLKTAISAAAWNRAQDAADMLMGQRPGFGAGALGGDGSPYTALPCKNVTASAVPRWGVLAISGLEITPSGTTGPATSQFESVPVLRGDTPATTTGDQFVIAVEPIAAGAIGRVAVDGVVQTKLEVRNAAHQSAGPKGSTTELVTGSPGAAVLWRESGTGAGKWALVRIGAGAGSGGGAVRLGTIAATWTKGATATVTQQAGDGTALSPATTFTATNYFATVTVPSGTRRVACALIDSTWVLIAAECA
jgi:hypothetical protein